MAHPAVRAPVQPAPALDDGRGDDRAGLPAPEDGGEPLGPLASMVRFAIEDDDAGRLVDAAASELRAPLALVAVTRGALAPAPDDALGRRAMSVARTSALRRGASPPRGWRVLPIRAGRSVRAVLAVGADGVGGPLLDAVVALLGEQLLRGGLRRTQIAAFVRRLVGDPSLGALRARDEAAALGLTLPDACWPAVVAWDGAALHARDVEPVECEARRLAPGSLTATTGAQMVLLHPAGGAVADVIVWVERVVARLHGLAPSGDARAVAADGPVDVGDVGTEVARLARLSRGAVRAPDRRPVTRAREHALETLLRESVAPVAAQAFVDDLVGRLVAWDREHRSDLIQVLEADLDSPRHDVAARRCFMHRNTFRHRLHRALEVLGDDLADPEMRLAVHVALKLRRATGAAADEPGLGPGGADARASRATANHAPS